MKDEGLVNCVFFFLAFFISLGILGVNLSALFLVLSGSVLSLAFMIGPASSLYLEVCAQTCISDDFLFHTPTAMKSHSQVIRVIYILSRVSF